MALELHIEVLVLREGDLQHGRVGRVVQQIPRYVPPVKRLPHLPSWNLPLKLAGYRVSAIAVLFLSPFLSFPSSLAPTTCRRQQKVAGTHVFCRLSVSILHERLQALLLFKGGDLLHCAKCREHQVQRVEGDIHARLRSRMLFVSQ